MYHLIITAIIVFAALVTAVILLAVWSCCKVSGMCTGSGTSSIIGRWDGSRKNGRRKIEK